MTNNTTKTETNWMRDFTPNTDLTSEQTNTMTRLSEAFVSLAKDITETVPNCSHKTAGLRKLLEAKWTVIQAVTHWDNRNTTTTPPTETL